MPDVLFLFSKKSVPIIKCKIDSYYNERKGYNIVPFELFFKIEDSKNAEHYQRNDFLNDFQLVGAILTASDAVCGYLKAILKKSDSPTDENDFPEGDFFVF